MTWQACENLLLIGAGFSKDFGGLLAREMWSEVFNDPEVRRLPDLRRQLDDSWPDYEKVYERVVLASMGSPEASALHAAVLAAYDKLDRKLRDPMGPIKSIDRARVGEMVSLFAPRQQSSRAGFVFSLNQDLFPERHAWGRAHFGFPAIPFFGGLPGRAGPYLEGGDGAPLTPADSRRAPSQEKIDHERERWLVPGHLHWLKLHGSQNWRDSGGRDLMVLGAGKSTQIQQEPILRWYWEVFAERSCGRSAPSGRHRILLHGCPR